MDVERMNWTHVVWSKFYVCESNGPREANGIECRLTGCLLCMKEQQ